MVHLRYGNTLKTSILSLSVALSACGGSSDKDISLVSDNSSDTVVSSETISISASMINEIAPPMTKNRDGSRKQLEVNVAYADAHFAFGKAFAHYSNIGSYVYFTIPVKNVSTTGYCFVQAENFNILNASGKSLISDDVKYVYGSSVSGSRTDTSTCLTPGDTGFFIAIEEVAFDDISSISFSMENEKMSMLDAGSAKRQDLAVIGASTADNDTIQYTVSNNTNENLEASTTLTIFLDEENNPINWTYLFNGELIEANTTTSIYESVSRRTNDIHGVVNIMKWKQPESVSVSSLSAASVSTGDSDLDAKELLHIYQAQESLNQERASALKSVY